MSRESSFFDLRPSGDEAGALTRFADAAAVVCAYLVPHFAYDPYDLRAVDLVPLLFGVLLFGFFGNALSLYRGFRGVPIFSEVARVWGAWSLTAAALLILGFVLKETAEFSRVVVTASAKTLASRR